MSIFAKVKYYINNMSYKNNELNIKIIRLIFNLCSKLYYVRCIYISIKCYFFVNYYYILF